MLWAPLPGKAIKFVLFYFKKKKEFGGDYPEVRGGEMGVQGEVGRKSKGIMRFPYPSQLSRW